MKKLLPIVAFACILIACNDAATDASGGADTAATQITPAPAPVDTASSTGATATMKDGLMAMKDGKMMVMKDGKWDALSAPVTCTNGRTVALNGEVSKGDKKRMMTEGMMIDKDGQMMDKDGKMMDNSGWE